MSSSRGVVETESGMTTITATLEKDDAAAATDAGGDTEFCVKKLPRVFYPLS